MVMACAPGSPQHCPMAPRPPVPCRAPCRVPALCPQAGWVQHPKGSVPGMADPWAQPCPRWGLGHTAGAGWGSEPAAPGTAPSRMASAGGREPGASPPARPAGARPLPRSCSPWPRRTRLPHQSRVTACAAGLSLQPLCPGHPPAPTEPRAPASSPRLWPVARGHTWTPRTAGTPGRGSRASRSPWEQGQPQPKELAPTGLPSASFPIPAESLAGDSPLPVPLCSPRLPIGSRPFPVTSGAQALPPVLGRRAGGQRPNGCSRGLNLGRGAGALAHSSQLAARPSLPGQQHPCGCRRAPRDTALAGKLPLYQGN